VPHGGVARARRAREVAVLCAVGALAVAVPATLPSQPARAAPRTAGAAAAAPYVPGVVVVGYGGSTSASAQAAVVRAAGAVDPIALAARTRLLTLRPGASVPAAVGRLRGTRDVAWAVPDYIAHEATLPVAAAPASESPPGDVADGLTAGAEPRVRLTDARASGATFGAQAGGAALGAQAGGALARAGESARASGVPFPNDPGTAKVAGGWQQLQWNFVGEFGVDAPGAWSNLIADHAAGGRGIVVAVLDTGVAYANRGRFRISPDFYPYQFVAGYDFVARDRFPNDRNGHGTDVAGTIAEATNNGRGLTGLAYGVRMMPVRVLNGEGNGDAATIAKGVRFAVNHGARVINLSLEFPTGIGASDIPELISALRYANRHHVVVVAAAGNEAHAAAAYPAHAPNVIAVGASTEHGCLASYSNYGSGVSLVAPGGGPDAALPGDPNCRPEAPPGRDVFQVTFSGSSPRKFGIPNGYEGTSMATPHVAATAALIIASGVLGRHPTPAQIAARLRATARPLGGPGDGRLYGAGLLDAAAATAPGGPGAVGGR
jgi:serine protease